MSSPDILLHHEILNSYLVSQIQRWEVIIALMINTYRESSLHASLKRWFAEPGDLVEQQVENYIIDLVRHPLLIEIQVGSFSSLKKKLGCLLENHPVHVVLPVTQERVIAKMDRPGGSLLQKRVSPKKGNWYDIFYELVYIASFLASPRFSVEAVMIKEEVIWVADGAGSWRRKGWSIADRKLVEIYSSRIFSTKQDYLDLLPDNLSKPFSVRDLAQALTIPVSLARKMAYCLRAMGALQRDDQRRGKAFLYHINR